MKRRIPRRSKAAYSGLVLTLLCGAWSAGRAEAQQGGEMASAPAEALSEGVRDGSLGAGDACDEDGRHFDAYAIDLDEGDWARIWVRGEDFDAVLSVEGPGDLLAENDDFVPGQLDPLVEFRAPVSGSFRVRVRAYSAGEGGAYRLVFTRVAPARPEARLADGADLATELGESEIRILAPLWGSFWIDGDAGERLRLRVTSPAFDTAAILIGPSGRQWSNDDAGDTGPDGSESTLDSTVNAILPAAGVYHLIVVPYEGSGSGGFRVRSSSRPPVVWRSGEDAPAEGFAGTGAEGRIRALFAGISTYPDEDDYLYGCADDALLLARAFRLRGLQAPEDQIVLTDAQVTRAAFIQALRDLAALATERDVVLIFYSGHGDQRSDRTDGDVESDGTDEELILYDETITDDDVVKLVDQIRADTIILALDACHSGGFERDFMSRPGRIGLFSSSEDVLSDTAEPLRSGGYLAYYLRRAVLGEGDWRPADGAMMAGELVDFIYAGFVASYQEMNPSDSEAPLQRLEADRGSRAYEDLLWLYPRRPDGSAVEVGDVALESPPPDDAAADTGSCR